ncbi:hypothetical protein PG279_10090 [Riemerella anatipestifer]|nr:hypothetical protein [Riemerella anatipestifer]
MNKELQIWAEKTVEKCNKIANDYYLDYYAFQKPYDEDYSTLILALNPYNNSTFPTKKSEVNGSASMTAEKFLRGNSSWNEHKTNWKVIKQLRKMKLIDDLCLGFNYMNYVYFPSRKFNDIKKLKEVDILTMCKEMTTEFLNLTKPNLIILLGTSTGIDQFEIEGNALLSKNNKRLIVKGKIGELDIYAIPHPSWLNDEELAAIDLNLREILNNEKQSYLNFKKTTSSITRNIIDDELKVLPINTQNKNYSDIILEGLDNEKILIRINYKSKSIGIRNVDKNNYENLKHHNFYQMFFKNTTSEKEKSWAFQKKFPSHFFMKVEDITKEIFNLVEGIKLYKK